MLICFPADSPHSTSGPSFDRDTPAGRAPTGDPLIEFAEIRLAIEPRAAALAASRATAVQRQELVRLAQCLLRAGPSTQASMDGEIAFHIALLSASNNPFMRRFGGLSEATLRAAARDTPGRRGAMPTDPQGYADVVEAVVRGEALAASGLLRTLLGDTLGRLLAVEDPAPRWRLEA